MAMASNLIALLDLYSFHAVLRKIFLLLKLSAKPVIVSEGKA